MADQSREILLAEKRKAWERHLHSWKKSGLTQKEYCRINNLTHHTFHYWKKKFYKEHFASVSLIPLQIKPEFSKYHSSPLSLTIDDRYKIDMDKGFDPETLFQVLTVLKQV